MAPGDFELMWHEIAERHEQGEFSEDMPTEEIVEAVADDYDHYNAPITEADE